MKRRWTTDQLKIAVEKSLSLRETIIKLGLSPTGWGTWRSIKLEIERAQINTTHWKGRLRFTGIPSGRVPSSTRPIEFYLVKNSRANRFTLKKRLIAAGLLKNECNICGISSWRDKPLTSQLDHINGIHNDNRLENLRLLCPNCHSQTPTYAGRNVKRKSIQAGGEISQKPPLFKVKKRPTRKILMEEIEEKGYSATGKKYGVSDNAIRKWLYSPHTK